MLDRWGLYIQSLEKYVDNTPSSDLDCSSHVSLKNKYIYIETPKVACSSIKITLHRLEYEDPSFTCDDLYDLHKRVFSPLLKLHQLPNFESYLLRDDFIKFCFVGNPYKRLLSCYLDKICRITIFRKKVLVCMGLSDTDVTYQISFREFIEVIERQSPIEMDIHWRAQSYQICYRNIKYDFIGRMESFLEDFSNIGRQITPDFDKYYITENRHQTNSNELLDKYYNDELLHRVYKLYEIDFINFNYEKELVKQS